MKNGKTKFSKNTRPNSSTKIKITNYSICNTKNLIINNKITKPNECRVSTGLSRFTQSDTTTDGLIETCSGINIINITNANKDNKKKTKSDFNTNKIFKSEPHPLKFSENFTNRVNLMKLYDNTFAKSKNKDSAINFSKSKNNLNRSN